jgi:hypothetical protein
MDRGPLAHIDDRGPLAHIDDRGPLVRIDGRRLLACEIFTIFFNAEFARNSIVLFIPQLCHVG